MQIFVYIIQGVLAKIPKLSWVNRIKIQKLTGSYLKNVPGYFSKLSKVLPVYFHLTELWNLFFHPRSIGVILGTLVLAAFLGVLFFANRSVGRRMKAPAAPALEAKKK